MSWVPTPPKAHLWYSKINKVHNRALVIIQSGVNHCTISFDLCLFSDENKNGEMQKKKKTKPKPKKEFQIKASNLASSITLFLSYTQGWLTFSFMWGCCTSDFGVLQL